MENKRIDKTETIEKIILKNKDGNKEVIEKGMIVSLSKLENGSNDMSIRFCNLDMAEVDNILYGFNCMLRVKCLICKGVKL